MKHSILLRLAFALAAELFFFAALNFFDDWSLQSMPVKFVEFAFLSGIAYLVAVSNFKIDIGTRKQAVLFWTVALALRLIALPLAPGDDLWRYQWEGKIQRAGFNPYLVAPDNSKLDELRNDFPQSVKINHPEFRAIYPPGAELFFRFVSGITDRPLFYKLLFAIVDLGTVAVLLRLIGGEERYRDAAWYAWNPLVVYSFIGAAHFDSLMILPLVGGILCLVRSTTEPESRRKWIWAVSAATLFGIGISIKLIPALLLLPCVFALRWRAIVLAISAAIPAALSLPFGFPKVRIWDSLGRFADVSRVNDLFWWLIEDTVWANPHQKNYHYNMILIVCVVVVSFVFIRNWKRGMLWVMGAALVLSPVLHPWYCTWILPIASWRRAYAWHVLSITLFAYYLFWDEQLFALPWHAEPWMRALIIAPVLAALVMLGARKKSAVGAN
ncbi:MAG TPA: glycosyltransferase 87 family protein [Chthoniobacterales bacterium]|nr:glycosyltransferase 87 family protein [Chthoniobacterales bacterium]